MYLFRVLEESLEKMSKLQAHWLEIREFFQLIENLVDIDVGKIYYIAPESQFVNLFFVAAKVDRYVNFLDKGRSASFRKKSYFKNRIFEYIQVIL